MSVPNDQPAEQASTVRDRTFRPNQRPLWCDVSPRLKCSVHYLSSESLACSVLKPSFRPPVEATLSCAQMQNHARPVKPVLQPPVKYATLFCRSSALSDFKYTTISMVVNITRYHAIRGAGKELLNRAAN